MRGSGNLDRRDASHLEPDMTTRSLQRRRAVAPSRSQLFGVWGVGGRAGEAGEGCAWPSRLRSDWTRGR